VDEWSTKKKGRDKEKKKKEEGSACRFIRKIRKREPDSESETRWKTKR
jgi:hypothetical protein